MGFEEILNRWEASKEGKKAAKQSRLPHKTSTSSKKGYPSGQASLGRLKKMRVQATLDLHGLTKEEASSEVLTFLAESVKKHLHKVQIVHGRGLHSPGGRGVLKEVVESILSESRYVRLYGTPTPSEGGEGAVWVILKKG